MGTCPEAIGYMRKHCEIVAELVATKALTQDDLALHRAVHEIMRTQKLLRYEPQRNDDRPKDSPAGDPS
jgi:hypothetical protein